MTGQVEQLALIPPPEPRLTDRQQAILDLAHAAGHDGIDAAQAGALLHSMKDRAWRRHAPDERCETCGRDGQSYLKRLAELGHVTYRRANRSRNIDGAWTAVQAPDPTTDAAAEPAGDWHQDGPIPYGYFPPGF